MIAAAGHSFQGELRPRAWNLSREEVASLSAAADAALVPLVRTCGLTELVVDALCRELGCPRVRMYPRQGSDVRGQELVLLAMPRDLDTPGAPRHLLAWRRRVTVPYDLKHVAVVVLAVAYLEDMGTTVPEELRAVAALALASGVVPEVHS